MQNNTQNSNNLPKRYIFVDTNVIQLAGDKNKSLSDAVINVWSRFVQEGYSLAISEISLFENLQGLWGKKVEQAAKTLALFEAKEVTAKVLLFASTLGGLYQNESDIYRYIETGDKIIASTAILENGEILTRNHKDFPSPFFNQHKWIPVEYKVNEFKRCMDLSLYKPNVPLIKRRNDELKRS